MRRKPENPKQLTIDWSGIQAAIPAADGGQEAKGPDQASAADRGTRRPLPRALVDRLPCDFATSFPQPTNDALDAGVLDASDLDPDNLRALHENYARQCLAALRHLAAMNDARRRGVDPATGRPPASRAAAERLRRCLANEPTRLGRNYRILIETYENAFGAEAARAFDRFVRARHAGIAVVADVEHHPSASPGDETPVATGRSSSALPAPIDD